MHISYPDESIIAGILSGGEAREKVLKTLFFSPETKAVITKVVVEGAGTDRQVDPLLEDCIVQLDKYIRMSTQVKESIATLMEQLAKELWADLLQAKESLRNEVLQRIGQDKKLKSEVLSKIRKNSGTDEDAEDCYQNGMIHLERQLREGKYRGGAIRGFFYQTCYNLWRNELKKQKSYSLDDSLYEPEAGDDPHRLMESAEDSSILAQLFEKLGESCRKIINLRYFVVDKHSMDEIAEQMGLKNAQTASNMLSKCKGRLWEMMQEKKINTDTV